MPSIAALVIQALVAILSSAPQLTELVLQARNFVNALFTAKLITKAEQDAIHAQVDAIVAMREAGIVPDHWKVEPDPIPLPDPTASVPVGTNGQ